MKTILISCLFLSLFSLYNNYIYHKDTVIYNNTIDTLNRQSKRLYRELYDYKQMLEFSLEHTDYLIEKLNSNKIKISYDDTVKLYLPKWYVLKDEY